MSQKRVDIPTTYYVYTYAFPDGKVFYIGKGCNARIDEHEREARSDCACNKCNTIRQIWEGGHPVQKRLVYETFNEQEALGHEYHLIQTYGLINLTNIKKGTRSLSSSPTTNQSVISTPTFSQIHDDFDLCYRALCSRDARFDGRFFTAVTSTGIYCRPVCPASTPHAQNVRFYSCAAAAEAAGFRACRRCHPESSPGSPDWNVRADLAARALRLIADGIVDSEGVSGLAGRLAVSERHLHRELVAEVGIGPLALARSRRAQTARLLIDQTNLSLTSIAFTAGFASVRQFNDTMQEVFACAPSEIRRRAQPASNGEGKLSLRLQYRPPFDTEALLAYLEKRTIPGVEEVIDGRYRRTIAFAKSRGIVEIEPMTTGNAIRIHVQLNDLSDLNLLVQRCRRLFDLDADSIAIGDVLRVDPLLAPLIDACPGRRVPGTMNGFEFAVRAIIGQQISAVGARTLVGRLVSALGEPLAVSDGSLTHTFPSPEVIAESEMNGLGITQQRIVALQALARSVARNELVLDASAEREETATRLQAIPGVGPWTAAYIAMRALSDPDAFPASDLGVRRAFEHYGLAANMKSVMQRAEAWRPWRAYATQYLWAGLAIQ